MRITKMMYGWSKWGGGSHGIVKEQLDEWHCQTCSELQVKELPTYMFPLDNRHRDFIRVCSKCRNQHKSKRITNFTILTEVRNL